MITKEEIGKEIQTWLDKDSIYVYTLVVYAFQEGVITEQEALKCKEDLDQYYKAKDDTSATVRVTRNKRMMEIFKKIGFTNTKVLWQIINQFPKRFKGEAQDFIVLIDPKAIIDNCNIKSTINLYSILDKIEKAGYISKHTKKANLYKINFEKLNSIDISDINTSDLSEDVIDITE